MKSISAAVALAFVASVAGAASYSFPVCPTAALVRPLPLRGPVSGVVLKYSFPVSGGGTALAPHFLVDGFSITILQDIQVNPIADIEIPPKCAAQILNVGPLADGEYVVTLRTHAFDVPPVSPPREREFSLTITIGGASGRWCRPWIRRRVSPFAQW